MLHGASESGPSQPPSSAPSQLGGTPPQAVNGPLGSQWGPLFPVLLVPAASTSAHPV
jgi:hypothetical protein